MTREEFFYQCTDVIDHWLKGNRKISDLREVTDKFYNKVTKSHWISVEDEFPKETGFYLVVQYDAVQAYWWLDDIKEWDEIFEWKDGLHYNKMEGVTHWMPMPAPPKSSCSEIPTNCQSVTPRNQSKGGEE